MPTPSATPAPTLIPAAPPPLTSPSHPISLPRKKQMSALALARTLSSSDSAPDSWDDPQEVRWPGTCLRPLGSHARRADASGDEEKEDGLGRAGRRSRPMTRKFFVGQWLDVKDTVNNWLEATVMDMTHSGERGVGGGHCAQGTSVGCRWCYCCGRSENKSSVS